MAARVSRHAQVARLKAGYYGLTVIATLAASYYFNYLFFFLHDRFGFGDRENLAAAAFHGGIYIFSAWQCGKFAERRGFHTSLKLGFGGVALILAAAAFATTWVGQLVALAVYSVVLLFIWPALEALVTEHEPPRRVPHAIGVYNCTWSGTTAFAYFTGGALYEWLGAGAVFWLPVALFLAGLFVVLALARMSGRLHLSDQPHAVTMAHDPADDRRQHAVPPQTFLRLAWVANPFSFVAIYTLLAVMPGLGRTLDLSPSQVGLFCSAWLFGRLGAFVWLWLWTGWHYRFGWLAGGFVMLAVSFLVILVVPVLWVVILAQVGFGVACGLMYYSSLFYSMDVGEARAEHGGLHEAAIGAGIFAGPAIGAASLQLFPAVPQASAIGVSGLLVAGFLTLLTIWTRDKGRGQRAKGRSQVGT